MFYTKKGGSKSHPFLFYFPYFNWCFLSAKKQTLHKADKLRNQNQHLIFHWKVLPFSESNVKNNCYGYRY